jgi:NADP-dependent 3-hydroxy acid dehydrogenase YdfG
VSDSPKPAPATPLNPRRRAILVGSSGGIGAALARKLAREGYALALLDRDLKPLQALCREINNQAGETRAIPFENNVTDYGSIPESLREIVADLGGLDLFIYVAGVIHFPGPAEYNFEEDHKMVEVNLLGAMAWLSRIAPLFQSAKSGQIVGVSSVAGDRGRVSNPGYNASKAGFTSYLESLRNRLTRHGVNVITIKPHGSDEYAEPAGRAAPGSGCHTRTGRGSYLERNQQTQAGRLRLGNLGMGHAGHSSHPIFHFQTIVLLSG